LPRNAFLTLAPIVFLAACKPPHGMEPEEPLPKPVEITGPTLNLIYSGDGRGEIAPCG
jgi:hypothetical protein